MIRGRADRLDDRGGGGRSPPRPARRAAVVPRYTFDTQAGGDVGTSCSGRRGRRSDARCRRRLPAAYRAAAAVGESGELELPPGWARVEFDNSSSWVRCALRLPLVCTPLEQAAARQRGGARRRNRLHRAAEAAAAAQRELSAIGAREAEARRARRERDATARAARPRRVWRRRRRQPARGGRRRALSAAADAARRGGGARRGEARFEAGRAERKRCCGPRGDARGDADGRRNK